MVGCLDVVHELNDVIIGIGKATTNSCQAKCLTESLHNNNIGVLLDSRYGSYFLRNVNMSFIYYDATLVRALCEHYNVGKRNGITGRIVRTAHKHNFRILGSSRYHIRNLQIEVGREGALRIWTSLILAQTLNIP